jgi:hypothetical protein
MRRNIFAEIAEVSKKLPPSTLKAMADMAQDLHRAGVFPESPQNHENPATGMPPARPETPNQETTPAKPAPDAQSPVQGIAAVPELTDADCIKRLEDTGFITQNTNIKNKTVYSKTRAASAPKIYRELLKMIDSDGERAKRIMINNISGVEAGLKQHLSRISKSNKK